MKPVYRNILLLILVIVTAHFTAHVFANLYDRLLLGDRSFSKGALDYLFGVPLSYTFFLVFLFTALGSLKKYWWMGILLVPAAVAEWYLEKEHLWFPIALAVVGWGLGWLLRFLYLKFTHRTS
jgi:hypothetical protein